MGSTCQVSGWRWVVWHLVCDTHTLIHTWAQYQLVCVCVTSFCAHFYFGILGAGCEVAAFHTQEEIAKRGGEGL